MKIRKLTIKNIASIESAELDFENGALKDAPLFLICGETGSGKTTILDCITLALYGKTPRYTGATVKDAQEIGGFAFNDARQLVRRGAASACATLSIVGNDGKPYEATWAVEHGRQERTKNRLKETWCWKDCSEGGLVETKKTACESLALRVTGLGFEQFCRTTLLAQGQFTKFLLGTENEKAEILEKLTDTSRYSKLGIAIADKYAALESEAKSLQIEIAQMSGLGAERADVEAKIGALAVRLAELEKKQKSLAGRLNWLAEADRRNKEKEAARTAFLTACAGLKAAQAEGAARVKEIEDRVAATRKYLADNEANAPMYEAAQVILTELGYVRDARANRAEAEEELAKHEKSLPTLRQHKSEAEKALKDAIVAADAETAKLELAEAQLEAVQLSQLRKDKEIAEKKRGAIETLGVRLAGERKLLEDKAGHERQLKERSEELALEESGLPALKKAFDAANVLRDQAQETWEAENRLLENGIEAIVAELKVGDECPICGSKIAKLKTAPEFAALAAKLKEAYARADRAAKAAERAYNAKVAAVNGLKTSCEGIKGQIAADQNAIKSAQDEMRDAAKCIGVSEASEEGIAAALAKVAAAIAELQKRIEAGEELELAAKNLSKAVKKLDKAREEARGAYDLKERACLDCETKIKQAKDAVKAEELRAEQSLKKAAAKIVLPGWQEAWEAEPEEWEAALDARAEEYGERNRSQVDLQHALELAQNESAAMTESMKLAVELMPEAAEVAAGEIPKGNASRLTDDARVRLDGCRAACQKLVAAKPQDLAAEDSVESLAERCNCCQEEVKQVSAELGAEKQKIADDDKCANDRTAKEKVLETVRAARDEWHPIYARFGDKDGGKIRREIQSYVLANVLVKANHYLKQLSDRYGLSCEGLVLSVADAFEGGAVRPVNTLSGGEQFLVSLALALGLAGMNDTGLGVDMLLIDEGFGTLSGEHLNAAIEALERLNAITGSRKVGVISHVERLRERIRTHVEVTRNGHAPSQVRVTTGNAN